MATPEALNVITYVFHLHTGQTESIVLAFDPATFLLQTDASKPAESWTELGFKACDNCPLSPVDHPQCPFATALAGFIRRFEDFYSYETAAIEVVLAQRTIAATLPLQDAMASIIGLIGATSGCPHLAFFRPMARFHLPFASEQETLIRAFSFHLLGEYLRTGGRATETVSVEGLEAKYRAVAVVNLGMAERIRAAFAKDAVVNAIVILDTFAQAVPFVVAKAMKELRPVFDLKP